MSELEVILERSKTGPLSEQDCERLRSVLQTLLFLTKELEKKGASIQRLRNLLFGPTTEKTRQVLEKALQQAGADTPPSEDKPSASKDPPAAEKPAGHGRNGARNYTGAKKIHVAHPSLQGGDACPHCKKGKVYEMAEPGRLVRIHGQAPLGATVYELQKLRCNLCGTIFTAPAPPEVGSYKYDPELVAMNHLQQTGTKL